MLHFHSLHLPSCYQGIINNDLLLIIDSGASICITPHCSNFITYQQSKMKIKDLSSSNNVAGECLLRWKIEDVSGRIIITFDLHGYHIPNAKIRLLSPQVLLSTFGGHTKQTTCKVEDHPCFWTETFSYSVSKVSEIKTILGSANINLTSAQKEMLLWHQHLLHANMAWIKKKRKKF
jgi:hypothetical protein